MNRFETVKCCTLHTMSLQETEVIGAKALGIDLNE